MIKPKCKTSFGIAICRFNKKQNYIPEILMIKKRYTYHYFSFIFGYYKKNNDKYLKYLFNNMTLAEKIIILTMNFSRMWYHIWLIDMDNPITQLKLKNDINSINLKTYFRKKNKFENSFLRDSGKRLKKIIMNSSSVSTQWEIPKGHKELGETTIDTGMRELKEETGISIKNYTLLHDEKPITVSHIDDKVKYKSIYYIAFLKKGINWNPKVKFDIHSQISEIEQVRWISKDKLEFLNIPDKRKKQNMHLFHNVINKFKKRIKSTYYKY